MSTNHGAVHQATDVIVTDCQGFEYGVPALCFCPFIEAIENGFPWTETLGEISPRCTGLGHPYNRIDEISVAQIRRPSSLLKDKV